MPQEPWGIRSIHTWSLMSQSVLSERRWSMWQLWLWEGSRTEWGHMGPGPWHCTTPGVPSALRDVYTVDNLGLCHTTLCGTLTETGLIGLVLEDSRTKISKAWVPTFQITFFKLKKKKSSAWFQSDLQVYEVAKPSKLSFFIAMESYTIEVRNR